MTLISVKLILKTVKGWKLDPDLCPNALGYLIRVNINKYAWSGSVQSCRIQIPLIKLDPVCMPLPSDIWSGSISTKLHDLDPYKAAGSGRPLDKLDPDVHSIALRYLIRLNINEIARYGSFATKLSEPESLRYQELGPDQYPLFLKTLIRIHFPTHKPTILKSRMRIPLWSCG